MSGYLEKYNETAGKVSPFACTVGTLISMFLPLSMIVFGGVFLNYCPAERYIPIYLIVSGCFTVVLSICRIIGACVQDDEGKKPVVLESITGVLSLFLFAWFIAGNVWIYRLHNKYSPDPKAENYCDNTLYLYAFWVTTVSYILLGALFIGCCCMICCWGCIAACIGRARD